MQATRQGAEERGGAAERGLSPSSKTSWVTRGFRSPLMETTPGAVNSRQTRRKPHLQNVMKTPKQHNTVTKQPFITPARPQSGPSIAAQFNTPAASGDSDKENSAPRESVRAPVWGGISGAPSNGGQFWWEESPSPCLSRAPLGDITQSILGVSPAGGQKDEEGPEISATPPQQFPVFQDDGDATAEEEPSVNAGSANEVDFDHFDHHGAAMDQENSTGPCARTKKQAHASHHAGGERTVLSSINILNQTKGARVCEIKACMK